MAEFKLEGTREVIEALDGLQTKEFLAVIRAAERKALVPNIIAPLRVSLPYSPKSKKSILIVNDKQDKTALWAGATTDVFWWRFVERGTKERTKGHYRGKITARPKIVPIIEQNQENIIKFFNEDFGTAVEQVLLKRLKKYGKKIK